MMSSSSFPCILIAIHMLKKETNIAYKYDTWTHKYHLKHKLLSCYIWTPSNRDSSGYSQ